MDKEKSARKRLRNIKKLKKQIRQTKRILFYESAFKRTLTLSSVIFIVILIAFLITLFVSSTPTLKSIGFKFIFGKAWNPVTNDFGALPFLIGTLETSVLALIISTPFALAVGLFLGEYYPEGMISGIFKNVIELLASIPSVVYGFWGIFVLVPIVRNLEIKLNVVPYGLGIATASVILAIMIMPYSVSLSRQVIALVPRNLKEGAYALGATRYEVIKKVIIPYTRSGLFAGILLALGRALGETMAVTMLIGNSHDIPKGIFAPGNTMASLIANEFTEATGVHYLSALIEMGLLLFIVTFLINMLGSRIIKRFTLD